MQQLAVEIRINPRDIVGFSDVDNDNVVEDNVEDIFDVHSIALDLFCYKNIYVLIVV